MFYNNRKSQWKCRIFWSVLFVHIQPDSLASTGQQVETNKQMQTCRYTYRQCLCLVQKHEVWDAIRSGARRGWWSTMRLCALM